MNELKVYRTTLKLTEGRILNAEVYRKSEADKVIADKDKEIADLVEKNKRLACKDLIMASETIKDVFKELRHQKYKRCLAMAYWCSAELGMLVSTWEFKIKHYKKWQKRWLKIAEKFKPNSSTAR